MLLCGLCFPLQLSGCAFLVSFVSTFSVAWHLNVPQGPLLFSIYTLAPGCTDKLKFICLAHFSHLSFKFIYPKPYLISIVYLTGISKLIFQNRTLPTLQPVPQLEFPSVTQQINPFAKSIHLVVTVNSFLPFLLPFHQQVLLIILPKCFKNLSISLHLYSHSSHL